MAELELGPLRIGIVGAGRLGCVIGRALLERDFTIVAATSATPEGRSRAVRRLDVPVFDDPLQATYETDVVLICTPDDALPDVAARLAERDPAAVPTSMRIVHTSGCIGLEPLEHLRAAGHDVLSMHPLQTITTSSTPADLVGVAAAVTAHDQASTIFGHALAHALGMHPFDLDDAARPLYHAASTIAANFTVTLQSIVADIAAATGMHEHVARAAFARLAHAALTRVEQEGPEAALTGPIVRGDRSTVSIHLAALDDRLPQHARTYRALAHATVQLATAAGELSVDDAAAIDATVAGAELRGGNA